MLQLLGQGFLRKEIAVTLGVSENSVKVYLRRGREKLKASTRAQAVLLHERVHRTCLRPPRLSPKVGPNG